MVIVYTMYDIQNFFIYNGLLQEITTYIPNSRKSAISRSIVVELKIDKQSKKRLFSLINNGLNRTDQIYNISQTLSTTKKSSIHLSIHI